MADWNRDDEEHMNGGEEEEEGIISQEDCWSVIQSYFDENVSRRCRRWVWLTTVVGANTDRIV